MTITNARLELRLKAQEHANHAFSGLPAAALDFVVSGNGEPPRSVCQDGRGRTALVNLLKLTAQHRINFQGLGFTTAQVRRMLKVYGMEEYEQHLWTPSKKTPVVIL